MQQTPTPCAAFIHAAIKPGYKVAYSVQINGKEILSRGEVFQVRRIGKNTAEITLLHAKTGALFVNKVKANAPVMVYSAAFAPMQAPKEEQDSWTQILAETLMAKVKADAEAFYALPIAD